MWSHHVISLVIASNNILLNLYLFTILSLSIFQYIKPHLAIAKQIFYITLMKNTLAAISSHYPTAISIFT